MEGWPRRFPPGPTTGCARGRPCWRAAGRAAKRCWRDRQGSEIGAKVDERDLREGSGRHRRSFRCASGFAAPPPAHFGCPASTTRARRGDCGDTLRFRLCGASTLAAAVQRPSSRASRPRVLSSSRISFSSSPRRESATLAKTDDTLLLSLRHQRGARS